MTKIKASYVRFDEDGDVVLCEDRDLLSRGKAENGCFQQSLGLGMKTIQDEGDDCDDDCEDEETEQEESGNLLRQAHFDLYSKLKLQQGTDENNIESQAR